jgi:hypothetical protein
MAWVHGWCMVLRDDAPGRWRPKHLARRYSYGWEDAMTHQPRRAVATRHDTTLLCWAVVRVAGICARMTARAVPCNLHEGAQLLARRVGSAAGTSCCTDAEAEGPGPNGSTRIIRNAIDVERLLRPAPANDPIFFALGTPHPVNMDDFNRRADHCPKSSGLIDAPDYFTSGRPSGPRTSLPSCSTASSVIIYLTFPPSSFCFCRSCQFKVFPRFLRLASCLFAFTLFMALGHAIIFSSPT